MVCPPPPCSVTERELAPLQAQLEELEAQARQQVGRLP